MRIIKLGIISIIFFFLLITAFSLFIPSRVRVSRALNTGVASDSVFSIFVKDLSQWEFWYPGFDTLPFKAIAEVNAKITEAVIGNTTVSLVPLGDSIVEVKFSEGNNRQVVQAFQRVLHPISDSVTIHWYMDFRLRWYPWEKFSGLMFEKRYGPRMEQGLLMLRQLSGK